MKKSVGLLISVLAIGIAGCGNRTNNSQQMVAHVPLEETERKVDLERAAKLNIELGLTYLNQGYVERAKSKLNRALRLAPNLSETHSAMGYYYEKVGEIKKAERFYHRGVELNPKSGKEHNNYGVFLCRQHRFREAESEFMLALKDSGYVNTSEVLENAGLCVLPIPDKKRAEQYFERALQHDPKRASVLLELAWLNWQQGEPVQAKHYYDRFQQVGQPNERALKLGIAIAKAEGNKNKEASLRLMLNSGTKKNSL